MKAITLAACMLAGAVACTSQEGPLDGRDDDLVEGKADNFGFTRAELAAAVRAANTLTRDQLANDVGIGASTADLLMRYRLGVDWKAGTDDDYWFKSSTDLDLVPYVGPNTFAALVEYARNAGWLDAPTTPLDRFAPTSVVQGDRFGEGLALAGDTLVVGAVGTNHWQGAVRLFERSGATWQPSDVLVPPSGVSSFGSHLAADTNTIAVTGMTGSGSTLAAHVYVYERAASGWRLATTLSTTETSPSTFATSLALAGDYLAVGDLENKARHVHVYHRTTSGWSHAEKLTSGGTDSSFSSFGDGLALANDILVVGSDSETNTEGESGAAYTYDLSGTRWQGARRLWVKMKDERYLGRAVATDGERIAIASGGAWNHIYVFARSGDQWSLQSSIPAPADSSSFAASLAFEGDTLLAGDPMRHIDGTSTFDGAVFTFGEDHGTWTQQPTHLPTAAKGQYGRSVLLRDGVMVTGAWAENVDTGAVYSN